MEAALTRGAYLEWGPTRDDPNPLQTRVVNVLTVPGWRGRGVARALLEPARPLYAVLGFHTSSFERLRRERR